MYLILQSHTCTVHLASYSYFSGTKTFATGFNKRSGSQRMSIRPLGLRISSRSSSRKRYCIGTRVPRTAASRPSTSASAHSTKPRDSYNKYTRGVSIITVHGTCMYSVNKYMKAQKCARFNVLSPFSADFYPQINLKINGLLRILCIAVLSGSLHGTDV